MFIFFFFFRTDCCSKRLLYHKCSLFLFTFSLVNLLVCLVELVVRDECWVITTYADVGQCKGLSSAT